MNRLIAACPNVYDEYRILSLKTSSHESERYQVNADSTNSLPVVLLTVGCVFCGGVIGCKQA